MSPLQMSSSLPEAWSALRPVLAPTAFFSFLVNILLFTSPLYMMQIYDRVLSSRSVPTLVAISAIALFLLMLMAAFEFVRSRLLVRAGMRFEQTVGVKLISHLSQTSQTLPRPPQELIRDADTVRDFLSGTPIVGFLDAPWTPMFLAVSCLMHPMLGLLTASAMGLIVVLTLLQDRATRAGIEQAGRSSTEASTQALAFVRNAEVVRALGMRAVVSSHWVKGRLSVLESSATVSDRAGAFFAASKLVRMVMQSAVLGAGAYLALLDQISPGAMLAASIVLGRALAPIELVVANWKGLVAARDAYGRLSQLFAATVTGSERLALPAASGNLQVEAVAVRVPHTDGALLGPVSFAVSPGEIVVVVGPSGGGKSTLMRVLAHALQPSEGTVRLDGYAYPQWDPDELGRQVGYVPQDVELFPGTVAQNIARLSQASADGVIEAATRAGVHEFVQRLPHGYETRVGQGGVPLSGGQRQRIALARALFGDPKLIVLDEPNSNLDNAGDQALLSALVDARGRKATIIVVTHKPNLLAVADRVMVLEGGTIRAFGSKDQVLPQIIRPVPPVREERVAREAI